MSEDARQYAPAAARNRDPDLVGAAAPASARGARARGGERLGRARGALCAKRRPRSRVPAERSRPAGARQHRCLDARPAGFPTSAPRSRSMPPPRRGRSRSADVVLCFNMIHIAPWEAAIGLVRGAARVLSPRRASVPLRPLQARGAAHRAEQRGLRPRVPEGPQSRLGRARSGGGRRACRRAGLRRARRSSRCRPTTCRCCSGG